MSEDSKTKPPFLRRVKIRNYRSIEYCDVELSPLTVLVGRNGSGRSNFIDAIMFVRDAIQFGVDIAIESRGGYESVARKGSKSSDRISISLEFALARTMIGSYEFEIGLQDNGGHRVSFAICHRADIT